MARMSVHIPDDLARRAAEAGLDVSRVTSEAVRAELSAISVTQWLDQVRDLPPTKVNQQVIAAVRDARRSFWA